ncbi:hypothetical protein K1T71_001640 [Dendrolimus kikuchii]|uniref:Uncharacterized protein n=1 Tax=Dendrolimus kikuchii TaxID=765133 RepID=A0ACC1DEM4_9NEOP|nr:hypothetical protein K1T71_001640 [Dendrolimus kikuchii]
MARENPAAEAQESLLYSARHGELAVVRALLDAKTEGKLTLDVNCKGRNRSNCGWTPLHLATYFRHVDVVEALLEAGANVDEVNDTGDTPMHKASFIGNEELVILLLKYKADVNIMNGEGRTACDVARSRDVQRLLEAAQRAERHGRESALLNAAKDGKIDDINKLLNDSNPPNINCVDAQGNTCLHCAAYRGHARLAVLLLQNGIDTTLRNNSGGMKDKMDEMIDIMNERSLDALCLTETKRKGCDVDDLPGGMLALWSGAVLQRGVLIYYGSRAEAGSGGRWRTRKYLDAATVTAPDTEPALLVITFSDGETHRLALAPREDLAAGRQSWVTALNEHIAYSGHYLWAGACPDRAREATEDLEDECKPLGSMQDAFTAATNSLALLETQLRECGAIVAALDKTVNVGNSLHHSAYMRFQHACGTGAEALVSLRHCAALVAQQKDADAARLNREIERNRVLEEALAALARTHHDLEMSVAEELTKSKRKKTSSSTLNESKENFFDVFDESDNDDDTLVTAGLSSPLGALSPWGSSPDLTRRTPIGSLDEDRTPTNEADAGESVASACSSRGTLVSQGGHVYRDARPFKRTTRHRYNLLLKYDCLWKLHR